MRILLDTNVISKPQKPLPSAAVERFLQDTPEEDLYLSIITIAELYRGVALMTEGRRRTRLSEWVAAELPERFGDRLLPITTLIAALWGDVMAQSRRNGLEHIYHGRISRSDRGGAQPCHRHPQRPTFHRAWRDRDRSLGRNLGAPDPIR